MFKKGRYILGALAIASMIGSVPVYAKSDVTGSKAKNVIMMIADGMSTDSVTLARWYQGGEELSFDPYITGLVRTYCADSAITDSAPAGTAFATGRKSHTGYIGVLPDVATMPGQTTIKKGDQKRPIANVLEGAQSVGKATGLVATSEIMHATPAAFSAHYPNRREYDHLSEQQVYNGIDVILGSGEKFFQKENRKDAEDLVKVIKDKGYDYVTTKEAMAASKEDKLWGMFAPRDLSYEFDRDQNVQPSLAEMTEKAIDVLSKDKEGFFLMVEGSKVDWASHANDPIGVISDTLSFEKAVGVAIDYAKSNNDTVVIVTTDHGNGGISIGSSKTNGTYDKEPLETFIRPLKEARLTGEGVEKKMNKERSNAKEVMAKYYGVTDLTAQELKAIKGAKSGKMNYVVGPMISKRARIGWTTTGHTGEDVMLAIYSPDGTHPKGLVENTELATYMANTMGFDLNKLTEGLFVPAKQLFKDHGAEALLNHDDPQNPVLVVRYGTQVIKVPINKNIAYVDGKVHTLDGIVVFNGEEVYVPATITDLLK